jgi:hypothetical protein
MREFDVVSKVLPLASEARRAHCWNQFVKLRSVLFGQLAHITRKRWREKCVDFDGDYERVDELSKLNLDYLHQCHFEMALSAMLKFGAEDEGKWYYLIVCDDHGGVLIGPPCESEEDAAMAGADARGDRCPPVVYTVRVNM